MKPRRVGGGFREACPSGWAEETKSAESRRGGAPQCLLKRDELSVKGVSARPGKRLEEEHFLERAGTKRGGKGYERNGTGQKRGVERRRILADGRPGVGKAGRARCTLPCCLRQAKSVNRI